MTHLELPPSTLVFLETEQGLVSEKLSNTYLKGQSYEIEEITPSKIYFKSLQNRAARGFVLKEKLELLNN